VQSATTTPEISRDRPRRKGEITRERILDAAEALFAERGFEGTTLRDVAASVGLRNPSLYNHFDSKESLYAAVLERDLGPLLRLLVDMVEQRREATAEAEKIIAAAMQVLAARPGVARLVQHEILSGGQRLTPLLRDYIVPILSTAHEMSADRALAAGWEKDDVPLIVLAMLHVVVGFFTMAPLYKDLNGIDLLAEPAVARQTRFLIELSERLFTQLQPPR
jgi:TetR/AcrR family transcriptional regulator